MYRTYCLPRYYFLVSFTFRFRFRASRECATYRALTPCAQALTPCERALNETLRAGARGPADTPLRMYPRRNDELKLRSRLVARRISVLDYIYI